MFQECLGKTRGLPKTFHRVCSLSWILSFGYMMGKVPALLEDLEKDKGLFRTYVKVLCPSKNLCEGVHSAQDPSFAVYERYFHAS